jgi:hypothetical protein
MPSAPRSFRGLIIAASISIAACSSGIEWDSQEKANARLLVRSLQHAALASQLASATPAAAMTDAQRAAVAAALRAALHDALQVNDTVLHKAHDGLPKRWRREYQPALQALLAIYAEGRAPRSRDPAQDFNAFLGWYRQTQPEFRWWPGGPGS